MTTRTTVFGFSGSWAATCVLSHVPPEITPLRTQVLRRWGAKHSRAPPEIPHWSTNTNEGSTGWIP